MNYSGCRILSIALLTTIACICGCSTDKGASATFTNPVIHADWPDPTVIDGGDGFYYSTATPLRTIRRSANLIDWEETGIDPLTPAARAKLTNLTHCVWAPSLARLGDKWLLYVSLYIKSSVDNRIIALVSDKVTGPYDYASEVINGKAMGILNAIDPYVFTDNGKVWMFFGSCQGGIHRTELTADGLSVKPGCTPERVAGLYRQPDEPSIWGKFGAYEGSYLLKRHGWWYLFVSGGKYIDHTYYLTVGRSRTLDGEFLDREGESLLKGLAKPILSSEEGEDIYGPGHNGEVFTAEDGSDWMFFHAHDKAFKPEERPTFLQELKWDEEKWPYFENGKAKRTERRFKPAKAVAQSSAPQLQFADPYVMFHDGLYYAYGTSHSNGIAVATSTDLKTWTVGKGRAKEGVALHRDDSYGDINFWAPEVYKVGKKFIMYYSAHSRICAAEADHPLGPFKQAEKKPIIDVSTIDNSLFIDDDGRAWMVYVVFDGRCIIWISEMEKDYLHAKPGTQRIIISPDQPWEGKAVTEGPFIIKVGKTYVLSYSANDYRDTKYAVGYATTDNLESAWKKYDGNPILCKKWGLSGTGHHSLFKDKDNRWKIAFHAHNSSTAIHPRCTYIADLHIDSSGAIPKLSIGDELITCTVAPARPARP